MGRYQVTGRREYRGHQPGTVFDALLDGGAERRAVARGDITLLEHVQPGLSPGSFRLPDGWLSAEHTSREPERALIR